MEAGQGGGATRTDQTLCACGSGLRAPRCCALDVATQADPAHHALLAPQMEAVGKARAEGRNREVTRLLLKILDLDPLLPEALHSLFEIRFAEGHKPAAAALAARIVALQPENANGLGKYAGILAAQEKYAEAIEVARRGLLAMPRLPIFHQILGMCYTELGALPAGEHHYRQALMRAPAGQEQLRHNLAWNLRQQGRLEEAAALYEALQAEGWSTPRSLTSLAQLEAGRGRWERVGPLLEEALKRAPDDRLATLLGAQLALRRGASDEALQLIAATETRLAPRQRLAVTEYVARGQALEQLGHYEQAWAAYQAGRAAQRQHIQQSYDPAPGEARLAAIKTTFKADRLAALPSPDPSPDVPQPVFLLGVPGSGTALLEHLLSQSPEIDPADQHAPLPALATLLPALARGLGGPDLPFPEALMASACGGGQELPAMLAARYLNQLVRQGIARPEARFATDRHADLPWLLGLAGFLFPQAPVIHLLRHPLDVVLSGFARDQLYEGHAGLTLPSLGHFYDLQMQAIAHIRGQMTLRYLPVRYEDLVTSPVETLHQIHRFIGLKRAAPSALLDTPPRAVPRVPAYRARLMKLHHHGLYRHRRFGDVFPSLTPWIQRLGYSLKVGKGDGA